MKWIRRQESPNSPLEKLKLFHITLLKTSIFHSKVISKGPIWATITLSIINEIKKYLLNFLRSLGFRLWWVLKYLAFMSFVNLISYRPRVRRWHMTPHYCLFWTLEGDSTRNFRNFLNFTFLDRLDWLVSNLSGAGRAGLDRFRNEFGMNLIQNYLSILQNLSGRPGGW